MPRKNKNKYPPGVGQEFLRHCWRHNAVIGQLRMVEQILKNIDYGQSSVCTPEKSEAGRLAEEIGYLRRSIALNRNDEQFKRKELK